MKERWCGVHINIPCEAGWGQVNCREDGTQEFKSCFDLPIKENCRYLIEEEDEPLFGTHLKEAKEAIKNLFNKQK